MKITPALIIEFVGSLTGASQHTRDSYTCGLNSFTQSGLDLDTGCLAAFDVCLSRRPLAKMTRLMYVQAVKRLVQWLDAYDRLPGFNLTKAQLQLRMNRGQDRSPAYTPRDPDPDMPLVVRYFDDMPLPPWSGGMTPLQTLRRLEVLRNRALMRTFISTAARLSEVLSLTRVQVQDGRHSEVRINGKGNARRTIFFSPAAQAAIAAYCAERADDCPALFVSNRRKALNEDSVRAVVKNAARALGMSPKTSPHGFRHYVGWDMLNNQDVSLEKVQAFLGHKNIATTRKVYAPTDLARLRQMATRYFAAVDPPAPTPPAAPISPRAPDLPPDVAGGLDAASILAEAEAILRDAARHD